MAEAPRRPETLALDVTSQQGRWGHPLVRGLSAGRIVVLTSIVVLSVVGVATRSGLFGDGAWFAVNLLLSDRGVWIGNPERWTATVLTQIPVAAYEALAGLSVDPLVSVYSSSLVLVPTAIWLLALWLARSSPFFWWLTLAWGVTFGTSAFFFVGEYNVTYALVALLGSIMLTRDLTRKSALAFIALVLLLARSYESLIFLAPLLVGMAVMWVRRSSLRDPIARYVVLGGAIGLSVEAVLAAISVNSPSNPGELTFEYQWALLDFWPAVVSALALLCAALAVFFSRLATGMAGVLLGIGVAVLGLGILSWAVPWASVNPWQYYNARVFAGAALFVTLALGSWVRWCPKPMHVLDERQASIGFASLALGLLLTMGSTMVGFANWVGEVERAVTQGEGILSVEEAGVDSLFKWDWSLPSLSILLRETSNQGIVLPTDDYADQLPFDPERDVPALPY